MTESRSARVRSAIRRVAVLALLAAPASVAAQGGIEGQVVSVAGVPLPYALVTLRPSLTDSVLVLTDPQGRFRFPNAGRLPATVRARAIGHRPDSTTVRTDTTVTLTLALLPRTIRPTLVRGVRCTDEDLKARSADPTLVALLEQARLNAEQFRQIAAEDDFVVPTHHTLQLLLESGDTVSREVDSLAGRALAIPGYRRGAVLTRQRGVWYVTVPMAAELASREFVSEHCFVYAGDDEVSGREVRKLLVAPRERIGDPDLEGELYLDAETFVLVRSTWRMTRLSPSRGPASALDVDIFFSRSRSGMVLPLEMRVTQVLNKGRFSGGRIRSRIDTYTYGEPAFARDVDEATWAKYAAMLGGTPVRAPKQ